MSSLQMSASISWQKTFDRSSTKMKTSLSVSITADCVYLARNTDNKYLCASGSHLTAEFQMKRATSTVLVPRSIYATFACFYAQLCEWKMRADAHLRQLLWVTCCTSSKWPCVNGLVQKNVLNWTTLTLAKMLIRLRYMI